MAKSLDYETVEYHLIYGELISTARRRGTVTYQELAVIVGLPTSGNHMGNRIGDLLEAVSENEVAQNRPMLSALVIGTTGKPGPGFIPCAKRLRLFTEGDNEAAFREKQRRACYKVWQQKFV